MFENPPISNLEILWESQAEFLARGNPFNEHVRYLLPFTIKGSTQAGRMLVAKSVRFSSLQFNPVDLIVRKY